MREKFSHPLTPHNKIYAAVHFLILAEGYRFLATHYEVRVTVIIFPRNANINYYVTFSRNLTDGCYMLAAVTWLYPWSALEFSSIKALGFRGWKWFGVLFSLVISFTLVNLSRNHLGFGMNLGTCFSCIAFDFYTYTLL